MRRIGGRSARTVGIACAAALVLALGQTPASSNPETAAAYLARLVAFGFSGTLVVASPDTVLHGAGFGLADREVGVPFSPRTIFDIGSVTKQFTAAAILRLAADGRLSVHDSIGRFFTAPADKRGITLHHLLTHTAGVPVDAGPDYERLSRAGLIRRVMDAELSARPGERHAYSNAGYSVLAAVVEVASGMAYEDFLKARLFQPAGLRETGYTFTATARPAIAVGYRGDRRWGRGTDSTDATGGDFWNLMGNGGLQSSAEDLARWASALFGGHVLPWNVVTQLIAPHVLVASEYREPESPLYYGYGWYVWQRPRGTTVFHDGGNGIFYASLRRLDDDRVLAFGSNANRSTDVSPVLALQRMLEGGRVDPPPSARADSAAVAGRAGRYEDATGNNVVHLIPDGGALLGHGEGQAALAFLHTARWVADAAFDSLNGSVGRFMASSRAGNPEVQTALFPESVDPAAIRRVEAAFWQRREAALGGYRGVRVLGTRAARTRPSGFPARTFVAVDFERGTTYREFVWSTARRIVDYGPVSTPPTARFLAESSDCVVAFEAEMARTARLCFDRDGSRLRVQHGGRVIELQRSP